MGAAPAYDHRPALAVAAGTALSGAETEEEAWDTVNSAACSLARTVDGRSALGAVTSGGGPARGNGGGAVGSSLRMNSSSGTPGGPGGAIGTPCTRKSAIATSACTHVAATSDLVSVSFPTAELYVRRARRARRNAFALAAMRSQVVPENQPEDAY